MSGGSYPNPEEISDNGLRSARWTLFILLLLVSNIIGFNSLIAVIGDSYDRVQTESAFYDAEQKFALLNELNDVYMFKNRNATEEPEKVFIHIIRYAEYETPSKDWQGKMQNMREVVVERTQAVMDKMDKQNTQIEKQNVQIKEIK